MIQQSIEARGDGVHEQGPPIPHVPCQETLQNRISSLGRAEICLVAQRSKGFVEISNLSIHTHHLASESLVEREC